MNINEFKEIIKQELTINNDQVIEVVEDSGMGHDGNIVYNYEIRLYTNDHVYCISANVTNQKTYLGCIASERKPRAGENWTRGNDLSDGDLSIETWNNIKNDIIKYELVKLFPKQESKLDIVKGN